MYNKLPLTSSQKHNANYSKKVNEILMNDEIIFFFKHTSNEQPGGQSYAL